MDISQNEIPVEEFSVSKDSTKAYSSETTKETERAKSFPYYSVEEYYAEYPEEMKLRYPYTYIMNKYMDIALDYMGQWYPEYVEMEIADKKTVFMDAAECFLPEDKEDIDLEATPDDTFFSKLYVELTEELNTFPIIQRYLEKENPTDYEDIILPMEGGIAYSKLDILYCYEKDIQLEHQQYSSDDYYEEDECGYRDYSVPAPKRLVRYNLLSKWLTDIRYRNYKESCPDMGNMREAMDEWEAASEYAIRFVEIRDNGWNRFSWGIGCNYHVCISDNCSDDACGVSSLGAVPWAYVHISKNCPGKGTCLHELGHTLTLEHEQCRPDRDCYINVYFENMTCTSKIQFHKFLETSATAYGKFDFESIMMYGSYAFSKNGEPTMTKKDGALFEAQRDHLSDEDKEHIRQIYY